MSPETREPAPALSDDKLRAAVICPYLRVDGGNWRYAHASREHRCTALTPPTVLAPEKQRRLCLAARHDGCPTFLAAQAARLAAIQPGPADRPRVARSDAGGEPPPDPATEPADPADQADHAGPRDHARAATGAQSVTTDPGVASDASETRWRFTRPTTVVLDHASGPSAIVAAIRSRGTVQVALAVVLLIAFAALAATRLPTDPAAVASPSPSATVVPTAAPTPTPTPAPPSASPTPAPTPTPTPEPTLQPTASPSPSASPATYIVQSGDTLFGIAARFGTTVAILQELNAIENPSLIRVGQVLVLP